MFYTVPEDVPPPPQKKMRKTFIRPMNIKKKQDRQARYSPWGHEEGDEEMLI